MTCTASFLGRAFSAGKGNTGAPGDETLGNGSPRTCVSCHSTNPDVNFELQLRLLSGNTEVHNYIPGENYTLELTFNVLKGDPVRFGFQAVALVDATEESIDSWSTPSEDVRIVTASSTGREYIEHLRPSEFDTFSVNWTAPESGTDSITFYAGGVAADLSITSGGDAADTTRLKVAEGTSTSQSIVPYRAIEVFPNPARDKIRLRTNHKLTGYMMYSRNGVLVSQSTAPRRHSEIDISDLLPGLYYINIQTNDRALSSSFIKL